MILGARARKNWSTFDVAEEGVRPALIIEVTSPETAALDRSVKLEEYDLAGVLLYVIVDTITRRREPVLRLLGYQQSPTGYQGLAPDEHGRLWLAPVRTWLGLEENEIVCYDEAGRPLGDYRALAAALAEEARARAAAEQEAAAERRARIAAEQEVAAERQARAAVEREAADERRARTATEERLREIEAELRRLRGETP